MLRTLARLCALITPCLLHATPTLADFTVDFGGTVGTGVTTVTISGSDTYGAGINLNGERTKLCSTANNAGQCGQNIGNVFSDILPSTPILGSTGASNTASCTLNGAGSYPVTGTSGSTTTARGLLILPAPGAGDDISLTFGNTVGAFPPAVPNDILACTGSFTLPIDIDDVLPALDGLTRTNSDAGLTFNFTRTVITAVIGQQNAESRTKRVIANYMRRRADQITANDPDLVQRLNQSSDAEGGVPVNLTGSGTLDNNQFAFSSSLRQMLASKKVANSPPGQNPSELMALGQSSVVSYGGPASGFDIWVQGKWAHVNDSAREHDIGLLYLGVDYRVNANLVVGFLAQLDHADENDSSQRSTVDGTGWLAGPYVVARLHKNLIFDARGAWGQSFNDIELSGTSSGSFDTTRWLGRGRLTGDFKQGLWRFAPHVGVIYFEDRQDRFTDSAGNTISSQLVSLGRFTFGPKISYSMSNAAGTVVTPHVAINGIWDFKNSEIVDVSTGLAAGSDDVRARVEGGVSVRMANGWSINGTGFYDGIGADNLDIYGGSVKVRIPLH